MKLWLYIFGSTVRGEIDIHSDVDILAIVEDGAHKAGLPKSFLVYSQMDLESCFSKGDLFAHHLASESRLIHSSDGSDILKELGTPADYQAAAHDLSFFCEIADGAIFNLKRGCNSFIFEHGVLYMAIRDVAMILSYFEDGGPIFSKYAPYKVSPRLELAISKYDFMKHCRAASTRGPVNQEPSVLVEDDLDIISSWLTTAQRILHERL